MEKGNKEASVKGGLTFCEALGLIFIVLKLCNVIDWGWAWVLLPIYGPFVLFLAFISVILTVMLITFVCSFITDILPRN